MTGKLLYNLVGNNSVGDTGHSNRLFSVRFSQSDDDCVVSGGWDDKIVIWDIKTQNPKHTLLKRMIKGDAIDMYLNRMLSCSTHNKDQIQLFDVSALRAVTGDMGEEGIPWDPQPAKSKKKAVDKKDPAPKTQLYCCRFSSKGTFYLAGGATKHEARVFTDNKTLVKISELGAPVTSCGWSKNDSKFLICGMDGYLRLYDITLPPEEEDDQKLNYS